MGVRVPPVSEPVREALARLPAGILPTLEEVRSLIIEVAAVSDVGPLTETLKWGEPAYLTKATKSGTTVRLGTTRSAPDRCAVFFNCKTNLVASFRDRFVDDFDYEGSRALILPRRPDWSRDALSICLYEALTYHRRKRVTRAGVLPERI